LAGTPAKAKRQLISFATASLVAWVGALVSNVPIIETPIVYVLTAALPEWAARTARSMPPLRPSKIWPYLSTRKL
jgi:hypothetical protein